MIKLEESYLMLTSQNGALLCGGNSGSDTYKTCIQLSGGSWIVSHNLLYSRYRHTSWVRPDGSLLLIGGVDSSTTSEVLNSEGGSTRSFDLKYESS